MNTSFLEKIEEKREKLEKVKILLAKNKKESGHTISYGSMNQLLNHFGLRNGKHGDMVVLITSEQIKLNFSFNEGKRCYCGVKGNANLVSGRTNISIINAYFVKK